LICCQAIQHCASPPADAEARDENIKRAAHVWEFQAAYRGSQSIRKFLRGARSIATESEFRLQKIGNSPSR
jgi:hypothetical protein